MDVIMMPSVRRTVTAGVRICRRMGLDQAEALSLIVYCADSAAIDMARLQGKHPQWLADVAAEASARHDRLLRP